jgi:hypothetical protein
MGVVGGRALRLVGQDSVPLAGASVVLHRLSAREQGPVDSVVVGRDGRFRFGVTADTLALLLASTRYSGIEYFSRPARMAPGASDTALLVLAADTSSVVPILIGARYLVVNRPGPGGGRGVLDLIVLQNRGGVTLVASDSTQPSWRMRLPAGLAGFEVGDGEVSQAAVGLAGDTLTISSPFPPGERQLVVTYALPAGRDRYAVPLEGGADSVVILLEEPAARVTTPGFSAADSAVIEGRTYRRWIATGVPDGEVSIRLPGAGGRAGARIPSLLAALLGGGLLVAGLWIVRRARPLHGVARPQPGTETAAALIERLAQLDRRYAGRESEVEASEWGRYREQRSRLKAELEGKVRGGPGGG